MPEAVAHSYDPTLRPDRPLRTASPRVPTPLPRIPHPGSPIPDTLEGIAAEMSQALMVRQIFTDRLAQGQPHLAKALSKISARMRELYIHRDALLTEHGQEKARLRREAAARAKQARKGAVDYHFVRAAEERLPPDVFRALIAEAKQRLSEEAESPYALGDQGSDDRPLGSAMPCHRAD